MSTRRGFLTWLALAAGVRTPGRSCAAAAQAALLPHACGFDAAAAATSDSDVGSLYPFIASQCVREDFPLSFLNERFEDAAEWKALARARFHELLHYSPARCEPRPEVVASVDRGDHVRETVLFNTTPDVRVPAFVLVPKERRRPLPAIVALHDHGGFYLWGKEKLTGVEPEHPVLSDFKRRYYAGNSIADVLVARGYLVVVIDMFYWGERRMLLDDDPADWRQRPADMPAERIAAFNQRASQNEQLVGRTILAAGFTWPGVIFWDDIRTVDYLLARPDVDPERIGCVGLSVGGLRACHLAALDERVRAAVVVGWMASFPAQLRRHVRHTIGHTKLVPGLYRYLDYPDVAALALPRPLLVINGSRDGLFELDGVRSSFQKLAACYAKAGVAERFGGRLYDTPHEFNAEMQQEAWEWLERWV